MKLPSYMYKGLKLLMSYDYIDEAFVQIFKIKAWSSGSTMIHPVIVCEACYWHLVLVMIMKVLCFYFNIMY
jgi:hypothetical protein